MKKFTRTLAVLLVIALAVCFIPCINSTGRIYAEDDDEPDYRQQLADLNEEMDNLRARMSDLEAYAAEAASQRESTEEQLVYLETQIKNLQEQVDISRDKLETIKNRLEVLRNSLRLEQQDLEDNKEIYRERARANYEAGTVSYLDVLFSAGSFSDYLTRMDLVEQIMQYDQMVMDNIKENIENINTTIAKVEEAEKLQQEVQDELDAQMAELEAKRTETENLIASLKEEELAALAEKEAANAELEEMMHEYDEIIAANAAQDAPGYLGWPVPGHTIITSNFGYRYGPFGPATAYHTGVDIGVSYGTPVYAPAPGTVIATSSSYGGGLFVTIDHGGGLSTRFLHLSAYAVNEGDWVDRGDLICYSGNSGAWTTGPHLHFEVRIYNPSTGYSDCVDPFDYVQPY